MASLEKKKMFYLRGSTDSEVTEVKEKILDTFRKSNVKRKDNKCKLLEELSVHELTKQFPCRLYAGAISLLLGGIGRWSGRETDASQAERLGRSYLSILPRSRSHARLGRNATMSHASSCMQLAFIDL
ncbi:hypothetical protein EVAR_61462_1 [Eumeta japonica]|uniref:Uncharacterized protein n=1 Tax=Eumeta variegata TaxID=151549 RepID=A0A4C1Z1I8_EUMVA|nr:hypothetical protein EVAR_61462_1 [Eumeta japonica]